MVTTTSQNEAEPKAGAFRSHLPDLTTERFVTMRKQNAREYAEAFKKQHKPPWLHALYMHWLDLLAEPFKGVTVDGQVRLGLFDLEDQGVDIARIVKAAKHAVSRMNQEQKGNAHLHIDSPEWRTWSNPEFLLSDKGIRLDEVSEDLRSSVMEVLRAALSSEGYDKAVDAMRINGYLGELVEAPAILNEFSYNFVIFGKEPSETKPWGLSFYGHHLCLNFFFYKTQIILSPWFTGAEPNFIDDGPYRCLRILQKEESLGLQLMQSLPRQLQDTAQIYKKMKDPAMPFGRWNHDDQRHLCGAYRDNRVVPYEGVLVADMPTAQQEVVTEIFWQYLIYLPSRARELCLAKDQRLVP